MKRFGVCIYIPVVLVCALIIGHVSFVMVIRPYGNLNSYENLGNVIAVTLQSLGLGMVLGIVGAIWCAVCPANLRRTVFLNAILSTMIYSLCLFGGVFKLIPLDVWDNHFLQFGLMVLGAAIGAHLLGFAAARAMSPKPHSASK